MTSIDVHTSAPPLGEGRFGTVYRATNTSTGENLAAKVYLSPENDPGFGERMCNREWKMLVKVQGPKGNGHPNILRLVGRLSGTSVAVQLATAGDLLDLLQKYVNVGFPGKTAEPILRGIMSGLVFLHETCGVMHGDLKSENIAMKDATTPLLADFDAATDIGTKLQFLRGTEEYLPPEWTGNSDDKETGRHIAAAAADIWSAGMISLTVLTGVHAWNVVSPPMSAKVLFNDGSKSPSFWLWRDEQVKRRSEVARGLAAAPADPWDRLLASPCASKLVLSILTEPKADFRPTATKALEIIGPSGSFADSLDSLTAKKIKKCKKEREASKVFSEDVDRVKSPSFSSKTKQKRGLKRFIGL